jgi:hypothetical protein
MATVPGVDLVLGSGEYPLRPNDGVGPSLPDESDGFTRQFHPLPTGRGASEPASEPLEPAQRPPLDVPLENEGASRSVGRTW